MVVRMTKVLRTVVDGLSGVPVNAPFSAEEILVCYKFVVYLVNILDDMGVLFRGHTYRNGRGLGLLVVKVVIEDKPMVCFVNGRSLLVCMEIFLEKLDAGTIAWREDRYA